MLVGACGFCQRLSLFDTIATGLGIPNSYEPGRLLRVLRMLHSIRGVLQPGRDAEPVTTVEERDSGSSLILEESLSLPWWLPAVPFNR